MAKHVQNECRSWRKGCQRRPVLPGVKVAPALLKRRRPMWSKSGGCVLKFVAEHRLLPRLLCMSRRVALCMRVSHRCNCCEEFAALGLRSFVMLGFLVPWLGLLQSSSPAAEPSSFNNWCCSCTTWGHDSSNKHLDSPVQQSSSQHNPAAPSRVATCEAHIGSFSTFILATYSDMVMPRGGQSQFCTFSQVVQKHTFPYVPPMSLFPNPAS